MTLPLVLLILAPRRPVVAWLPTVTKGTELYRREPLDDPRVFAITCFKAALHPLKKRFDVPEAQEWTQAMRAAGVIAEEGPRVPASAAIGFDLYRARIAARKVHADYLVSSAVLRSTSRRVGFDSGWYRLDGVLTLIDVRTGRRLAAKRPINASLTVSGPTSRPVAVRTAEALALAMQQTVAKLIDAREK